MPSSAAAPLTARQRVRGLLGVAAILLVLALPMSIVSFVGGRAALRKAQESASWPRVPATIVASQTYGYETGPTLDCRYTYVVHGQALTGRRVYHAGVLTPSRAQEIVARFPTGQEVEAFVNPADPSDAVLLAGPQPGVYVVIWVPVGLWIVLGSIVLVWWFTRPPRGRRAASGKGSP